MGVSYHLNRFVVHKKNNKNSEKFVNFEHLNFKTFKWNCLTFALEEDKKLLSFVLCSSKLCPTTKVSVKHNLVNKLKILSQQFFTCFKNKHINCFFIPFPANFPTKFEKSHFHASAMYFYIFHVSPV